MKSVRISIGLLFVSSVAAFADCEQLNTSAFLEAAPWEDVVACVEQTPEVLVQKDERGNNLLMTALMSEIQPMRLDDLLNMIPPDLLDEVTTAENKSGRSLGHIAASEAPDPFFIFVLSRHSVDLSAGNPRESSKTPLHLAAQRDSGWRFVAALLMTGAKDVEDNHGRKALDLALSKDVIGEDAVLLADSEWPILVPTLLEPAQPSAVAQCDGLLTSQFFESASQADVVACLKEDSQLIAVDHDGNSILHLAAQYAQDPWVIDWILGFAEDPAVLLAKRNSAGRTPLHLAAETGTSVAVLLHLLAWGGNPDALLNPERKKVRKDHGISALHVAASRKDVIREDMVLMLLAYGADTMLQDTVIGDGASESSGRTALHRAVLQPDPEISLMLLQGQSRQENFLAEAVRQLTGKAVKQISDAAGRTALHLAASRASDLDTLRLLLAYGFSVDERDDQGITPLMFAAQHFTEEEYFLFLLATSEDPCGSSSTGVTVEGALRSNQSLMPSGVEDTSGRTLSPLALVKQRCP